MAVPIQQCLLFVAFSNISGYFLNLLVSSGNDCQRLVAVMYASSILHPTPIAYPLFLVSLTGTLYFSYSINDVDVNRMGVKILTA